MTRTDIAARYAKREGISYLQANRTITSVMAVLIQGIKTDNKVEIRGLGVFKRKTMKARKGRNPQNGETLQIPEKVKVCFRVADNLKKSVNGEEGKKHE